MNTKKLPGETHTCREALSLLLDNIGFDKGACSFMDPVGICIPADVLPICREAIENYDKAKEVYDYLLGSFPSKEDRKNKIYEELRRWHHSLQGALFDEDVKRESERINSIIGN